MHSHENSHYRYKRELKEWDELLELKRAELEQAKQNCESNKKINYSNLRSEDVSALKTYLTPDQLKLLEQPSTVDPMFMQHALSQLQDIVSREISKSLPHFICLPFSSSPLKISYYILLLWWITSNTALTIGYSIPGWTKL